MGADGRGADRRGASPPGSARWFVARRRQPDRDRWIEVPWWTGREEDPRPRDRSRSDRSCAAPPSTVREPLVR
ncbi:hypothetical protein GS4_04_00090 [Gordonia soli NBRC 108243]|uniref:Uncharacterized protein n=1 Tax=Gordonia soli NBRC 108243 TaxID=1223545 RepID=M0QH47_9ACTN|nr:hypothetical protein GS4_04_00090 [Gordonia soli NBRC 108243]